MLAKNCASESIKIDKLSFKNELINCWLEYENINYNQNTLKIINILFKLLGKQLPSNVLITEDRKSKKNTNIIYLRIIYL